MSGTTDGIDLTTLSTWKKWGFVVWLALTVTLGTWGYMDYSLAHAEPITWATAAYHTLQLFILHAPHFEGHLPPALEVARWSAALGSGGVLVGVAIRKYEQLVTRVSVQRASGHVVVCGLGRKGLDCVEHEHRKGKAHRRDVVVVDHAPPPAHVRRCEELGVFVITGDATNPAALREAGVERASMLFALCPSDNTNCDIAVKAAELLSHGEPRHTPLNCIVHVSDLGLRESLQKFSAESVDGSRISLRYFDLFDVEARRLLLSDLPIDHDGISFEETRRPHLVLLGFGRMGRAVALRAAKVGHFANACRDPLLRLKISVVDRAATAGEEDLLYRYPQFRAACDLQVREDNVESPDVMEQIERWICDPEAITCLVVCLDDEKQVAALAARLIPKLRNTSTRVALRLSHRRGLASVMDLARRHYSAAAIRPFGMIEDGICHTAFDEDEREKRAEAFHTEFVRTRKPERESTDPAMRPWRSLAEDLRESNRQHSDHVQIKLRAIGCEVVAFEDPRPAITVFSEGADGAGEVQILAQMEHNRWNAERWLAGWTYAPGERNIQKRTSPYLASWSELTEKVRGWDKDAVRAIPRLLEVSGRKACRKG